MVCISCISVTQHTQSNVTVMDTHVYYRSFYYPPSDPRTGALWYDLSSMVGTGGVQVDNLTSQLSGLHRYYEVSVWLCTVTVCQYDCLPLSIPLWWCILDSL